ncbi:CG42399 [Drosophila busckii]|uniref:CG42399 n=1 Tax=Drosophila busckii TaxID=30019 RepID=A0A0M4E9F3_DROBS|nr:CG42399 [Drosophila busckii]
MQRRLEQGAGGAVGNVQLTPLWEHVLRTRRLPENICPASMFAEFHERLQDAEWQVRQHALRVLVDVLVVMQSKADGFSAQFLIDLIKNLGHQAPTVRKGALDCLRVYLAETEQPAEVLRQILNTGLSPQLLQEERLSCGVLLSLPALLQSILHTPQRQLIAQHIIERLLQHLQLQQNQQELSLKVLGKLAELLGPQVFDSQLNQAGGKQLYKQLCELYGLPKARATAASTGAWRALPREHSWRGSAQQLEHCAEKGKVIMETEIKINDDTLTMRILEAETETEEAEEDGATIESPEYMCRQLPAQSNDDAGILEIISDSEAEEQLPAQAEPATPSRSLKRVTFGGEIVKMRTPDSDAASCTPKSETAPPATNSNSLSVLSADLPQVACLTATVLDSPEEQPNSRSVLTLDIPNDNTKPLETAAAAHVSSNYFSSPKRESQAQSPSYRCRSISPASISPKIPHKQIEVLHNLQRDVEHSPHTTRRTEVATPSPQAASIASPATPKSWEELDIVDYQTIKQLRSGDWRQRLQGITQLELALSSSANLLLVQPYLDSLLRTLLCSERNFEVAELKRELLVNLITRLPLDNLEERAQQILTGLCRQGNAGANRVCQALMQRLPAGTIVAKLTAPEYLHAKSSKFRDHALQMSIYALMTFPGTCFDLNILTEQVTYAALNRKRRVRQTALEVLAVLANISSKEQIQQLVAQITSGGLENGAALLDAVKMRLSRQQLPIITADAAVLYSFNRLAQGELEPFGADVDWIKQGEGSASPNAIKRRRMQMKNKNCSRNNSIEGESYGCPADENLHRHSYHSPPEALDLPSRSTNDFYQKMNYASRITGVNLMERRLEAKTFSESSMDGRSTDSNATTCSSSGSGSFIQLTPCNATLNKRLVGQNSRFPVMRQHSYGANNFMRNVQHTHYPYSFEEVHYSKSNFALNKAQQQQQQQQRRKPTKAQTGWTANSQGQQQLPAEKQCCNKSQTDVAKSRQVNLHFKPMWLRKENRNVEVQANAQQAAELPARVQELEHAVDSVSLSASVKSVNYSQKSTASAKSFSSQSAGAGAVALEQLEQQFEELVVDDIEEEPLEPAAKLEPQLKRNESNNSLHSKTESIRTQLEDTTPQLSRAQSVKSIEEQIEGSNSFVLVEQLQQELTAPPVAQPSPACSSRKSSALPSKRISLSLDSLYGERPYSKQGSLDNSSTTTTDNSSQLGCQLLENCSLPAKPLNTPLKQKSKTSYLLRGQRRVSPVKQAIKMSQTELFPSNMSRFEKPREALMKTFDQLDSPTWEHNMTGLKCMVRLIRYHQDMLDNHMHMSCIQLTRSVRNLRSQVARAACQAATELFTLKYKSLEQECDDLVCALLHRTADTNRFLRADATRALESMADNLQPAKVLNILTSKGAQHQNALVRTTTAKLLYRLVERLGSDRIYAMSREQRDKFFQVGANLLLEGSLETRSYAKSLFRALSDHSSYQRLLLEVIPPRTYRNVEKTLRSITH